MLKRGERNLNGRRSWSDRIFGLAQVGFGVIVLLVAAILVGTVWRLGRPAFAHIGLLAFLRSSNWDPVSGQFGALPFVYGTLVTSAVALVVAVPIALGLALFVTEMAGAELRRAVRFLVEILAAIPSVVYGLWGLLVLVPLLRDHVEPLLGRALGFLPIFRGPPLGLGYLAAGLLLAIMILPTIASVSIEVLAVMPSALREGALALGATRWEAIRMAVLPFARRGLVGATILGLGRALGETMAVTMVIGNQPEIHASLFAPGYSLPAVIANEFAEATDGVHVGALASLALCLFAVTLLLSALARVLVRLTTRRAKQVA